MVAIEDHLQPLLPSIIGNHTDKEEDEQSLVGVARKHHKESLEGCGCLWDGQGSKNPG